MRSRPLRENVGVVIRSIDPFHANFRIADDSEVSV
jgi:hypothetical protein